MVPQHPGRQQQGLGAPTAPQQGQGQPNPYVTPNEALAQANGRLTGETEMKLAQAQQAGAQAGKMEAEANLLRGLGAMGQQAQAAEQAEMQKIQMDQITSAMMQGATPEQLVQQGADPRLVEQGIMYMQQQQIQAEQQYNQQQGLGRDF